MLKIDRTGFTYMQHVLGAPREGKGLSVEIRPYALRNSLPHPPRRQHRSPVSLQVELESLREGREAMTSAGVM